ncbi:hypothetical protein [Sorangium sp. So ce131]|uniref:hypothetical protein n=1 Tax=Sorangium sp. So ce131 TaxID=3133282 RepID=UPI003F617EB9
MTTGALNELVLLEFLSTGRFRKHIDRLQQKLGAARNAATRRLRDAGVQLDHPGEGGLFLWGEAPRGVDVDELVKDAYLNKILLVRGATFMADAAADPHIRFNVAFSQHVRLSEYLTQRFEAVASARRALARAGALS